MPIPCRTTTGLSGRFLIWCNEVQFENTKGVLVASWSNYQIWCLSNIVINSAHPYVAFVAFHFFVPWWLELRTCLLSHIKLQGSEQHHWASTCCPPQCRWTADLGKRWELFQRDVQGEAVMYLILHILVLVRRWGCDSLNPISNPYEAYELSIWTHLLQGCEHYADFSDGMILISLSQCIVNYMHFVWFEINWVHGRLLMKGRMKSLRFIAGLIRYAQVLVFRSPGIN